MNRYQFEDLISNYIEKKLPLNQRKEFEAYLAEHPDAVLFVKSVKEIMHQMHHLPPVKTSPGFMSSLQKRIEVEKNKMPAIQTSRAFSGYTPLMAGLFVVMVFAVIMLGIEFIPIETQDAGLQPRIVNEPQFDQPVNQAAINNKTLLNESEEDSSEVLEEFPNKKDFQDRIKLVGDKRQ